MRVTNDQIETEISHTCHACVVRLMAEGHSLDEAQKAVYEVNYTRISGHVRIAMMLRDLRQHDKQGDSSWATT